MDRQTSNIYIKMKQDMETNLFFKSTGEYNLDESGLNINEKVSCNAHLKFSVAENPISVHILLTQPLINLELTNLKGL